MLYGVNVMTSEASHGRLLEAAAPLQHLHLAAVDVNRRRWIGRRYPQVLFQRFARNVGERWLQRRAMSGVAPGAKIHLAVAGESRRIQDGGTRGGRRFPCEAQGVIPA